MKNHKIIAFILACLVAISLMSCSRDPKAPIASKIEESSHREKQWERISETNNGTFYIDANSIRRDGQNVTALRLIDYHIPPEFEGKKIYSGEIFERYDCTGMVVNQMKIIAYSENMAQGDVIQNFDNLNRVITIDAGTPIERVFAYLCK